MVVGVGTDVDAVGDWIGGVGGVAGCVCGKDFKVVKVMDDKIKVTVTTKRVFKKMTTVTLFQAFKITFCDLAKVALNLI